MTAKFMNVKINQLEQQKLQAEEEVKRFEEILRDRVDPDVDEADPGLTLQTVTMALLTNARRKVELIARALKQAQNGGYGICELCGQPINPERLAIFPQATLCVHCKSVQERRGFSGRRSSVAV